MRYIFVRKNYRMCFIYLLTWNYKFFFMIEQYIMNFIWWKLYRQNCIDKKLTTFQNKKLWKIESCTSYNWVKRNFIFSNEWIFYKMKINCILLTNIMQLGNIEHIWIYILYSRTLFIYQITENGQKKCIEICFIFSCFQIYEKKSHLEALQNKILINMNIFC